MNKVILMGRLTRDPEVRYSQGEKVHWRLQDTHWLWTDRFKRDGEPDGRLYQLCMHSDKTAEFAEKYFRQGMQYHNQWTYPDRKLHKQRWRKGLYDRCCRRRAGICGEQELRVKQIRAVIRQPGFSGTAAPSTGCRRRFYEHSGWN